jgi:hypothetical protein
LAERSRELYRSANGDTWLLVHDSGQDKVIVRHIPNAPSGGKTEDVELSTFLARGSRGPEHKALLDLIKELVAPKNEGARSAIA